jgi:hypothetical protein
MDLDVDVNVSYEYCDCLCICMLMWMNVLNLDVYMDVNKPYIWICRFYSFSCTGCTIFLYFF